MRRGECQVGGRTEHLRGREWRSGDSGETGSGLLCTVLGRTGSWLGSVEHLYHTQWLMWGYRNVGR